MEARAAGANTPGSTSSTASKPAGWVRPFVRLDALWTRIEMYLVLSVLLAAILYMTGWVTLNAFHNKGGKLAYYPGSVVTFAGVVSLVSWIRGKERRLSRGLVSVVLLAVGAVLLLVAKKQEYFANIAHWLADASLIKLMGTPNLVSARLFTIWVALLGGSLATGAGRQINIDVVMRFLGPKPRLVVALISYVAAATSCFVISWAFVDFVAITGYGADREAKAGEKVSTIQKGVGRHIFLVRKQIAFDFRSVVHVVFKGEKYDEWYTADEWNAEVNSGDWATVYPAPVPTAALPAGAPPYSTKPCLSDQEKEELSAKGGSENPDWKLPQVCSSSGGKRAPVVDAPSPDDSSPLDGDLALLFPWGFFIIGCRFLLRGVLAVGGAVSTDPNSAHGDGDAHGPLAEHRVDEEALAHVGKGALPPDDVDPDDNARAESQKLRAGAENADSVKQRIAGEPVHHTVEDVGDPHSRRSIRQEAVSSRRITAASKSEPPKGESKAELEAREAAQTEEKKKRLRPEDVQTIAYGGDDLPPIATPSAPPPEGVPTAERLEAAQAFAEQEEEERTLVGDLSELARAQEALAKQEDERRKKGLPSTMPPRGVTPKKKGDA